ncbi:MAG: hypothetical protein JXB47_17765 [Anaerolineae bacterium]|nr:hypothetical protein [Anaerolineae bacterium]
MGENTTQLETVMAMAQQLSQLEQMRLVEWLVAMWARTVEETPPKRSSRGILAHLGPAPSAEEIDEARREMWGNFPRKDIA